MNWRREMTSLIVEGFKRNYAKAVVFINIADNYELAGDFVSSIKEVPFPLLVLKIADGKEILSYLELHQGGDIQAKVDAENQVDAKTEVGEATEKEKPGFWQNILPSRVPRQSKQVADLKVEVQRLMFSGMDRVIMSEDIARFQLMMSAFHNYEKSVSM